MTAENDAFAALAKAFERDGRVTSPGPKRGSFGSNGFKVLGRIFAMQVNGRLAVKLPKAEVDDAASQGRGERLVMGKGRVMKEWLVVHEPIARWRAIAERARDFVAATIEAAPSPTRRPRSRPNGVP